MGATSRYLALSTSALLALVGLVLGITVPMLDPTGGDLLALVGFLLISGAVTVGLGLAAMRFGLPRWVRTIRGRLVLMSVLSSVLALANVGFVALLMFLSSHDLALLAGLLAFSVGLTVVVAIASSEPTARKMREVVDAVRSINAGSLETRVPVESRDEVGELAAALNAMVHRLQVSFGRERDLENTRRELVGAVSHDLRTPLASIRAMIESINDGVVSDEETVRRYLRIMQSEVENLSQLINDLFELSQIDAGTLVLHIESSSVQELISDTLEGMAHQAAERRRRGKGAGRRHGRGYRCQVPAATVRASLSCRPVAVTEIRRCRTRSEYRQGDRRGARRKPLGRERAGQGERVHLHAAEGGGG